MITKEHLDHWIYEINYALNGILSELSKKQYAETKGLKVNEDYLSLEYLREKENTIRNILNCIQEDIERD